MTTTLDDLIARLEKAEGPDRKVDLAISLAINYRSAFDEVVRAVWSPMADDIEVFDAQGRRGFLDPAQFVPLWTRSIDAALTLVPESCDVRRFVDDPSGTGWTLSQFRGGVVLTRGVGVTADLPALALCIAALKARKTESAA